MLRLAVRFSIRAPSSGAAQLTSWDLTLLRYENSMFHVGEVKMCAHMIPTRPRTYRTAPVLDSTPPDSSLAHRHDDNYGRYALYFPYEYS